MGTILISRREALLPALALAGRAIERRNTIPILGNVLLEVEGGVSVTGTDLDIEISASFTASEASGAAITLPAALLHDAVRKLPEGADIRIEADDTQATVSAARTRFRMPVLPAGDFPRMSQDDWQAKFELQASELLWLAETVGFAMSSEEARYYLNGIYVHVTEDAPKLRAVATDGHRLARVELDRPEGAATLPGIIVPRKTVGLLKNLGETGPVTVEASDTRIRFTGKAGSITSKLIDGSYPDYQRVIPAGNANRFRLDRKAFGAAVDRMATMSAGKGSAVKFGFSGDALALASINPDLGSAEDAIALETLDGDPVEIGFNGRYCLDMLNVVASENLIFELGDAGAPALVRADAEDARALFVLMPMRV